jgi:nitrogen fixation NifU-like protein
MAYGEKIIDHYQNPRNVGSLDRNSPNVGTGIVGAPECGDVMKLQILVDEHDNIVDAKFKTFGCGSAIASSSLATEWMKIHCSVLAEDAVRAAIADLKAKRTGRGASATPEAATTAK